VSDPFLGEVRITAFNFAPRGWALADGQLLPINQNQALFSILGTNYGGDGRTTFALPNLQGRVPTHVGGGNTPGGTSGSQTHTVTAAEMAIHTHEVVGSSAPGNMTVPGGNLLASGSPLYAQSLTNPVTLAGPTVSFSQSAEQPHNNNQPYLVLSIIIALQGIFPSRS
jgi:microcystin-dependent protein